MVLSLVLLLDVTLGLIIVRGIGLTGIICLTGTCGIIILLFGITLLFIDERLLTASTAACVNTSLERLVDYPDIIPGCK